MYAHVFKATKHNPDGSFAKPGEGHEYEDGMKLMSVDTHLVGTENPKSLMVKTYGDVATGKRKSNVFDADQQIGSIQRSDGNSEWRVIPVNTDQFDTTFSDFNEALNTLAQ